jgi:hypothetical protein
MYENVAPLVRSPPNFLSAIAESNSGPENRCCQTSKCPFGTRVQTARCELPSTLAEGAYLDNQQYLL